MIYSLGAVTGTSLTTAVRATNTFNAAVRQYSCQGIFFQALRTNTGSVYICSTATPNLTTGIGVIAEIPAPTSPTSIPAFGFDNPGAAAAFNLAELYILPTVSGEGVRVTATL
jgi:hypothetical protein